MEASADHDGSIMPSRDFFFYSTFFMKKRREEEKKRREEGKKRRDYGPWKNVSAVA
jgi:hypothetical protein